MVWSEAVGCSAAASWWPGRGRPSPGNTDLMPESAVQVEVVAPGLAGGRIADVGVQRMPVVCELLGAVGSPDRANPARHAGAGRDGAGHRGPVRCTASVALGCGGGVGGERVERE